MKNTLKNFYNIDSKAFIKYSDKVIKVKDENDIDYCLKYSDNQCNNLLIEKINMLNLSSNFVMPIKTCVRANYALYNDKTIYLFPWLEDDNIESKDLKLKYYLSSMAKLHEKSSYTLNVSSSYFNELSLKIEESIEECYQYYDKLISYVLYKEYNSPFQWYLMFHFKDIISSLDKSKFYLDEFKKNIKDKSTIRQVIIHQNFSYDHVFLSNDKVIGNDKMKLASPVYDLYDLFNKVEFGSIDISGLLDNYFDKVKFEEYEKNWLLTLLFISKKITIKNEDFLNVKNLMNVIFSYKCALEIENKIKTI